MSSPVAEALAAPAGAATDRLAAAAFAAAVAIGGTNFVAIRFSNRELDALWGAGLRFALAAVVFGVLFAALRLPVPRGRDLAFVALYGLLSVGAAYGFLYWALRDVPAGVAAVVLAVGPLLTLLLAVAQGMERLSRRALAGAVVALAGSVVIFVEPGREEFGWSSLVLLGLAALCASEAVVVSKRASAQHPVAVNFVAMSVGAAVLLLLAWTGGDRLALPRETDTQLALAYLVAATVVLFVLVLLVVQRWTASATSYLFVLMPIVAVVMGALLLDEAITASTVVGGTIVCGGVWIGATRRRW